MIAASLLLASWVMVLSPLFRSGGDDLLSQAISLAYPIGDVVVGTIVLFVLARARMGRGTSGTPLPLLGAGWWPSRWPTAASCTSPPAGPTPRGR